MTINFDINHTNYLIHIFFINKKIFTIKKINLLIK